MCFTQAQVLDWLAQRSPGEAALDLRTGPVGNEGETGDESRFMTWVDERFAPREIRDYDARADRAGFAEAAGDPEPATLLGNDIRDRLTSFIARNPGATPWGGARDRNAEILRSRREQPHLWRPLPVALAGACRAAPALAPLRAAPRARGAGRPAARPAGGRATRAGPDDDPGPCRSDEPPGAAGGSSESEEPSRPLLFLVHERLGKLNAALDRFVRRLEREDRP